MDRGAWLAAVPWGPRESDLTEQLNCTDSMRDNISLIPNQAGYNKSNRPA